LVLEKVELPQFGNATPVLKHCRVAGRPGS
jgi:hypothetical protein